MLLGRREARIGMARRVGQFRVGQFRDTQDRPGGKHRGPRLVVDVRERNGSASMRFSTPPAASRARAWRNRLLGTHSLTSLAWRVAADTAIAFAALQVAAIIIDVPQSIYSAAAVAALGGVAIFSTGTYGFIGRPLRVNQILRLALGIALGMALHSLALAAAGASGVTLMTAIAGWTLAGGLSTLARVSKTRFEDRFRIISRSEYPSNRPVRHVLLIGGAGYIGSVLARHLLERGYRVTVLDRLIFGDSGVKGLMDHPRFRLIIEDFRDIHALVRAARGADAVIHLGAIVGDPACALDPRQAVDVNYRATRLIRDVCRGLGVNRLIFTSTCSVYGVNEEIIDEESALNPVSVYAASKIASERAVLEDIEPGFAPTVLRLATVFGWSARPRFDLVVNLLSAKALLENQIDVFNPHQWRPFIHLADAARAFTACLEAPVERVSGQIFNAGDDDLNMTLGVLGETFEKVFPGVRVNTVVNESDRRSYRVSFQRIRDGIGFRCTTSIEAGIHELRCMITESEITDYTDQRYSNVKHLREHPEQNFGQSLDDKDRELTHLRAFYESVDASVAAQ